MTFDEWKEFFYGWRVGLETAGQMWQAAAAAAEADNAALRAEVERLKAENERLAEVKYALAHTVNEQDAELERLTQRITELTQGDPCWFDMSEADAFRLWKADRDALADAKREAEALATWLWKNHYAEDSPKWELCDSVAGVISQIDNMVAGISEQKFIYYRRLCEVTVERDNATHRERLRAAHIAESGTEGCLCTHCILRVGIAAQIKQG